MINDNIGAILDKIKQLEQQLEIELNTRQSALSYQLRNRRIRFTNAIRKLHRQHKVGLIEFFRTADIAHIITAPLAYSLIIPLLILDIGVSVYQHICFRVYSVPRVKRSDFIVVDRHHLAYLNVVEKLNCVYCGYASGLIAYAREITARTEQYWCPIKHASRVIAPHSRFSEFSDYGDAEAYRDNLSRLRRRYGKD